MRALILTPDRDSPGRKDWSKAFRPEAERFADLHGIDRVRIGKIDVGKPWGRFRRLDVEGRLGMNGPLECVAFFCHGWMRGMQFGYDRSTVQQLADAIAARSTRNVVVPLYCCSTGDDPQDDPLSAVGTGDDSFADRLRDALCRAGAVDCRVTAHTTAAHTTRNPFVVIFDGLGSPVGGVGGIAPVLPGSALWGAWKRALRETDLRFRFPFMSIGQVHAELSAVPQPGAVA